jgi:hypothetical protein
MNPDYSLHFYGRFPEFPILSQMNLTEILTPYLFKICFKIILQIVSSLRFFLTKKLCAVFVSRMRGIFSSHFIVVDFARKY